MRLTQYSPHGDSPHEDTDVVATSDSMHGIINGLKDQITEYLSNATRSCNSILRSLQRDFRRPQKARANCDNCSEKCSH